MVGNVFPSAEKLPSVASGSLSSRNRPTSFQRTLTFSPEGKTLMVGVEIALNQF
jgi:hypothetical protein